LLDAGRSEQALALLSGAAVMGPSPPSRRQLLTLRERAQLVEGLRTGAWMPIDGLGPAIRTRRCGTGAEIESAAVVPGTPLAATAVLSVADALVTEARRDRAHVIRGGAEAGSTVAAAIAARRLGIDM